MKGESNTLIPMPILTTAILKLSDGSIWTDTKPTALRGIDERKNSLPPRIGTFQQTPVGGFFLNAFYDTNQSHGNLYELIYAGKFNAGNTVVYPMAGFEHLSAQYTRYFYGVSASEATAGIYPAYTPKATTTPMLGFAGPVEGDWIANIYMLR